MFLGDRLGLFKKSKKTQLGDDAQVSGQKIVIGGFEFQSRVTNYS